MLLPVTIPRVGNSIPVRRVAKAVKAIGVHDYGGPEALQVLNLPEQRAGSGEVRIRVHAAAVSPTDVLLRTGGHAFRMPDRRPVLNFS